jgi:hypothetical protein
MKPWTMLLARLGIAGACVMAVGCGNSDVPNPSADDQAATEAAPPPDGGSAPPSAAPRRRTSVAGKAGAPNADESSAENTTAAPAAEAEKTATPSKSEGGSATAEMLASATNSNSGGNSPPAADAAPAAAPGGTAPQMGSGMMAMMNNQGRPGMPPGGPAAGGASGPAAGGAGGPGGPAGGMNMQMRPGAMGGGPGPADMAKMMGNNQMALRGPGGQGAMSPGGAMGGRGMPGGAGGPGGLGGQGGAPDDNKPGDFSNPEGAVSAFLAALRAKDADRLNEACAVRASLEPPEKNKTLFKKIYDLSLSDSELDDLSKSFEGYKIAGENPAKSTARVEVVLQKGDEDGSYHRRVVTVRREGKDRKWGVLHIASPTLFKPLGQMPRRKGGNR